MNIITAPQVTLIGAPQFFEPSHAPCEWVGAAGDGPRLAEYAGRICYMSYANPAKRRTEEYLTNIMAQGHGSVLEHANYSFLLEGISRSCSHEIVRHRAGFAYSQLSQRYVDESDCAFVVPPAILPGGTAPVDSPAHTTWLEWVTQTAQALQTYTRLVEALSAEYADLPNAVERRKRAREAARSVLPNATETKLVMTGNVRAWRHFLTLRLGQGADLEIRRLAFAVLRILKSAAPEFFGDFQVHGAGPSMYATPVYPKV